MAHLKKHLPLSTLHESMPTLPSSSQKCQKKSFCDGRRRGRRRRRRRSPLCACPAINVRTRARAGGAGQASLFCPPGSSKNARGGNNVVNEGACAVPISFCDTHFLFVLLVGPKKSIVCNQQLQFRYFSHYWPFGTEIK